MQLQISQFAPQRGIYLLSHSVGCPPVTTRSAVEQGYFETWEHGGVAIWDGWLQSVAGFVEAMAVLLNAQARQICPQVNLSSALTKILFSLPETPGRNVIVLSESDFPSMGFVLEKAKRSSHELRFIPAGEDVTDPDTWRRYMDDDVALVFITHVHSETSVRVPVADITGIARQQGIISIVDIAQSVGVIPIDLESWQADFVIGSSVKWLCGGPGAAYLWLSEEMSQICTPVDVGWFSHGQPFEFDIHHFEYAPSALKFWGGTPSVLPYVAAEHSIRLLQSHGIDEVRRYNIELSQPLIDAAGGNVLVSPADHSIRGGTVVVKFPDDVGIDILATLNEAGVLFDERPSGIRLSPHIYNTPDEIETVAAILSAN
jgi:kynureninase